MTLISFVHFHGGIPPGLMHTLICQKIAQAYASFPDDPEAALEEIVQDFSSMATELQRVASSLDQLRCDPNEDTARPVSSSGEDPQNASGRQQMNTDPVEAWNYD